MAISLGSDDAVGISLGSDEFENVSLGDAIVWSKSSTIVEENAKAGSSEPAITGAGDLTRLGFSREMSVNTGETINFAIDGQVSEVDIYRFGHYGGSHWRKVMTLANTATEQPGAVAVPSGNGATECSGWSTTCSWSIPPNVLSGLFVAVPKDATNPASWIPFIVRNDERQTQVVVVLSTSTWGLAYNTYNSTGSELTGKSLYGFGPSVGSAGDRSYVVSADRPIVSRDSIVNHWDVYESAGIDFLEENGFDVKYVASHDLERNPASFNDADVFISMGHDEYWSAGMRTAVEAFRDAGGHCIFLSANEVFWKVRWTNNYRQMWCYKDSLNAGVPLDPVEWTGTWRDTRWAQKNPEKFLTGTTFRMNGIQYKTATVDASVYGASPFWRDTTVETGTDLVVPEAIGFEADSVDIPDSREYALLAETVVNIDGSYANDDGDAYAGNGTLNWGIVIHKTAPTAGYVVSFASMAWLWTLSDKHRIGSAIKASQSRQAMANLLYDLGASAGSLDVGLTTPTPVPMANYGLAAPLAADFVWSAADPTAANDPGQDYELGTRFTAAQGAPLIGVRVWNPGEDTVTGRSVRLWDQFGAQIVDGPFPFAIDNTLTPGWNEYEFPTPYEIDAGTYTVSYTVGDGTAANPYGAVAFQAESLGGVDYLGGYYNPVKEAFPNVLGSSFYGVDLKVNPGFNEPPEVVYTPSTVAMAPGGSSTAVATINDPDGTIASVVLLAGAPAWATLDGNYDLLLNPGAGISEGTYPITVRVTDNGGAFTDFVVSVELTNAPIITWFENSNAPTPVNQNPEATLYSLGMYYKVPANKTVTHVRVWGGNENVANRTLQISSGSNAAPGNQTVTYTQTLPSVLDQGWNAIELDTPQVWVPGTMYGLIVDYGDGNAGTTGYGSTTGVYTSVHTSNGFECYGGGWIAGHDNKPDNFFNEPDYFIRPGSTS